MWIKVVVFIYSMSSFVDCDFTCGSSRRDLTRKCFEPHFSYPKTSEFDAFEQQVAEFTEEKVSDSQVIQKCLIMQELVDCMEGTFPINMTKSVVENGETKNVKKEVDVSDLRVCLGDLDYIFGVNYTDLADNDLKTARTICFHNYRAVWNRVMCSRKLWKEECKYITDPERNNCYWQVSVLYCQMSLSRLKCGRLSVEYSCSNFTEHYPDCAPVQCDNLDEYNYIDTPNNMLCSTPTKFKSSKFCWILYFLVLFFCLF